MTNLGNHASNQPLQSIAFATDGKIIIVLDDLALPKNTSRAILIDNKSGKTFFLNAVQRFGSEITDFSDDALSCIDFDIFYTPDLAGATLQSISEGKILRTTKEGTAQQVSDLTIDIDELIDFNDSLVLNKKIKLARNQVSFFTTNQATIIVQQSTQVPFDIPYPIETGSKIVLRVNNRGKLPVGEDAGLAVNVDFVLAGALL